MNLYFFIFLGDGKFDSLGDKFVFSDKQGNLLFSASRDEILVAADSLKVTG